MITSASGANFAKGTEDANAGTSEVTMTLAVEVGERWRVRGWGCRACEAFGGMYAGFGRARICESMLISKKVSCSSMT